MEREQARAGRGGAGLVVVGLQQNMGKFRPARRGAAPFKLAASGRNMNTLPPTPTPASIVSFIQENEAGIPCSPLAEQAGRFHGEFDDAFHSKVQSFERESFRTYTSII